MAKRPARSSQRFLVFNLDGNPQVRPLQEMELARSAPWLIKPNSEFLTSFGGCSDILVLSTDLCPLVVLTYDSGELITGIVTELPKPIWKIEEVIELLHRINSNYRQCCLFMNLFLYSNLKSRSR